MAWFALVCAGALEIVWAFSMKRSAGFTRLGPSLATLAAMPASFALPARSMRTLPPGAACVVRTGIGAVGAFVLGALAPGEALSATRVPAAALIVAGLILMRVSAAEQPPPPPPRPEAGRAGGASGRGGGRARPRAARAQREPAPAGAGDGREPSPQAVSGAVSGGGSGRGRPSASRGPSGARR